MENNKLFNFELKKLDEKDILEKIEKFMMAPDGFFHIISLNPENIVLTSEVAEFNKVVTKAQIKLIDGVGVVLSGRLLGVPLGERVSGVDLMQDLVEMADRVRLRVVLIGAQQDLAERLAECYSQSYKNAKFLGISGFNDVSNPKMEEEERLKSIVADFMPQIVFAAFGSPAQELWLDRHSSLFKNCVCMGVGGGFDFSIGAVPRAPKMLRTIGLEWLFRLVIQPWRWRRQLRLFKFIFLVFKEKIHHLFPLNQQN